ncbi:hypothetical protein M404DRAFT_162388 [Pisolithus tinctorius Marx 270]|uniref:Uncharacterized protein n=1 Tax=Pisolithus tinctorius Marx 270 TaxID=870435 RepID=A0A0C3JGK7_PISTI|nr:hypothetical protein M404DRAFT_162388 [Pisolithus tinctorius Marx 270]
MAHAKDRHYWFQLRTALTAGRWGSETPAQAPNASPLSWSRLFYKFNKHCKGFQDVAQIAAQTRLLSLLLGANSVDEDALGNEQAGELRLGDECVLAPERVEEAAGGYQTLQSLESSNPSDSLHLALAYYAYALRRPEQCLAHLSKVSKLVDAQSHIPVTPSSRAEGHTLQVPGSATASSSPLTGSFVSAISSPSLPDISNGRAWAIMESLRSICLQGMSYETLYPSDPEKAIEAYAVALPLLNIIQFTIPRAPDAQSLLTSFTHYRELWRWAERLMFRAITLIARTRPLDEPESLIWMFFTHYQACGAFWIPTFRFPYRSIVAVLHLRALILKHRTPSERAPLNTSLRPQKLPRWLSVARSVAHDYKSILDECTHFPRAGERNVKVEDFVDLCVAVWEASRSVSDWADWVIDTLWWATKLTFNSYRIFRHMSRLLYVTGDSELPKRMLRLYVEVVGKSREAGIDNDCDTDRHWVETLVEGSRMLCRLAISRPGWDGVEEAKEAGEFIEKAKTRLDRNDKELVARVALAEGVWHTISGIIGVDLRERPKRFALALEQFVKSVGTYPTPAAHHHLAISLALPGPSQDLKQAIAVAGAAVEGEALEIRHWHLLGLLLTAEGQWDKAKSILEIGANIGETTLESDENSTTEQESKPSDVKVKDFETEKIPSEVSEKSSRPADASDIGEMPAPGREFKFWEPLLDPNARSIPPSATLLQPLPDHPPPSRVDAFEYALQLRLTQMALTEHVEGAEGAEIKWVNVYGWIAERKGSVSETPIRSSVDTSSRTTTTQLGSMVIVSTPQELENEKQPSGEPSEPLGLITAPEGTPPPITVTPATPADADHRFSIGSEPQEKLRRSASMGADPSTGKKVQQMLKDRVHKGQEKISTISRKIGYGVGRSSSLHLKRSSSAPDFQAVLRNHQYQASSIHSRRRLHSLIRHHHRHEPPVESPPAPPPPSLPPVQELKTSHRATREDKLLSDLWAASAATFRRTGKIDQAKGAIQEAEVKNPDNPNVWVQFGLYHYALGHERQATQAFQKALFISPDDVSAAVHMSRIYLDSASDGDIDMGKIDLTAGLLGYITRSRGWNVPEAWYYLAKAYGLQGRKEEERECLVKSFKLTEQRCIRDIGLAVGWCL